MARLSHTRTKRAHRLQRQACLGQKGQREEPGGPSRLPKELAPGPTPGASAVASAVVAGKRLGGFPSKWAKISIYPAMEQFPRQVAN